MIKTMRKGLILTIVVIVALGLAQMYGDDGDGTGVPDINENDRLVQIRYFADGGSDKAPVRFDLDGGFTGGVEFRENDKRNGHMKTGTTLIGAVAWSNMYLHVYSPVPTKMWCEVWHKKKEITYSKDVYPKTSIAHCAGRIDE